MDKCIYCNRKSESLCDFAVESSNELQKHKGCSEDCISKATSFLRYASKYTKLFWLLIALSITVAFLGNFFDALTAIGMLLLGVTVIAFPFATPQTVYIFGIKISKLATQVIGLVVIAVSFYNFYGLLSNTLA